MGGVHGLERIGTEVVLSYLRNLVARLPWDATLQHLLQGLRLLFVPVVNPGGLLRGTRANPRGVDLMRNAPVEAHPPAPFLLAGHHLSPALPWYRGRGRRADGGRKPGPVRRHPPRAVRPPAGHRGGLPLRASACATGCGSPMPTPPCPSTTCPSCMRWCSCSTRACATTPMWSSRKAASTAPTATCGTT
jgi:hypothetical protein